MLEDHRREVDVVGEASGPVRPDHAVIHAEIHQSAAAVVAHSAAHIRRYGHPITGFETGDQPSHLLDRAGNLVAHDLGFDPRPQPAVVVADVRAAQAAGLHPHHDPIGITHRIRQLPDANGFDPLEHRRLHEVPLPLSNRSPTAPPG